MTARMPRTRQKNKRIIGQNHQGWTAAPAVAISIGADGAGADADADAASTVEAYTNAATLAAAGAAVACIYFRAEAIGFVMVWMLLAWLLGSAGRIARLQAAVIILRFTDGRGDRPFWLEEALTDLVASARLAGLALTIVEVDGTPEREVVDLVDQERIDLLVFSEDQRRLEREVLELAPRLGQLIIQVREKDGMHLGTEEGSSRCPS